MEKTEINIDNDVIIIQQISEIKAILDVVCNFTGMGFAAVARVTEDKWVACAVKDMISFGLKPGDELEIRTTICDEIRQSQVGVVIDDVPNDPVFCNHHTPNFYGFKSYISMPIVRSNGTFFGTLCAIDPSSANPSNPSIVSMFKLFAGMIALKLEEIERLQRNNVNPQ